MGFGWCRRRRRACRLRSRPCRVARSRLVRSTPSRRRRPPALRPPRAFRELRTRRWLDSASPSRTRCGSRRGRRRSAGTCAAPRRCKSLRHRSASRSRRRPCRWSDRTPSPRSGRCRARGPCHRMHRRTRPRRCIARGRRAARPPPPGNAPRSCRPLPARRMPRTARRSVSRNNDRPRRNHPHTRRLPRRALPGLRRAHTFPPAVRSALRARSRHRARRRCCTLHLRPNTGTARNSDRLRSRPSRARRSRRPERRPMRRKARMARRRPRRSRSHSGRRCSCRLGNSR